MYYANIFSTKDTKKHEGFPLCSVVSFVVKFFSACLS
jgi:hypothetical protein